jgi:adenine deaminase
VQGFTTDHECFEYEEAVEKIKLGMKILIRKEVQPEISKPCTA